MLVRSMCKFTFFYVMEEIRFTKDDVATLHICLHSQCFPTYIAWLCLDKLCGFTLSGRLRVASGCCPAKTWCRCPAMVAAFNLQRSAKTSDLGAR